MPKPAKLKIHPRYGPALDLEPANIAGIEFHRYSYGEDRLVRVSADGLIAVSDLMVNGQRLYFARYKGRPIDGALPCKRRLSFEAAALAAIEAVEKIEAMWRAQEKAAKKIAAQRAKQGAALAGARMEAA